MIKTILFGIALLILILIGSILIHSKLYDLVIKIISNAKDDIEQERKNN